ELDALTIKRKTPLHLAAYHGHAEVVRYLTQEGANVHAVDTTGQTPGSEFAQHVRSEIQAKVLEELIKPIKASETGRSRSTEGGVGEARLSEISDAAAPSQGATAQISQRDVSPRGALWTIPEQHTEHRLSSQVVADAGDTLGASEPAVMLQLKALIERVERVESDGRNQARELSNTTQELAAVKEELLAERKASAFAKELREQAQSQGIKRPEIERMMHANELRVEELSRQCALMAEEMKDLRASEMR
ncbi:unnamed protein product, partial [Chrysoparadoxa australica]